jgi:hypothetical protein
LPTKTTNMTSSKNSVSGGRLTIGGLLRPDDGKALMVSIPLH